MLETQNATASAKDFLTGKRILVIGGTGSLGQVFLRRILDGRAGKAEKVVIFSRDEEKQYRLRMQYRHRQSATHDIIYRNAESILEFRLGDLRDLHAVSAALRDIDIVVNAAALKQVPTCEYFPFEAVMTNVHGAENIIRAIKQQKLRVETVVGVSTDKAVNPINVMGMTKALQERIFAQASLEAPDTRFVVVRYGNVLASRGSVIPLFHEQIRRGGPVTITDSAMTRFLLSLDDAVDIIFAALQDAHTAEIYVPRLRGARIIDIARAMIGDRSIKAEYTGVRPGEKLHEILVSDEETYRTIERGRYFVIAPVLPELRRHPLRRSILSGEYSSKTDLMTFEEVSDLLKGSGLMVDDAVPPRSEELLR